MVHPVADHLACCAGAGAHCGVHQDPGSGTGQSTNGTGNRANDGFFGNRVPVDAMARGRLADNAEASADGRADDGTNGHGAPGPAVPIGIGHGLGIALHVGVAREPPGIVATLW